MASDAKDLVAETEAYVRQTLEKADGSHDFEHIARVRSIAERIGREEGADSLTVSLGALLHDIADHKYHGGDKDIGARTARAWLESIAVPAHVTDAVVEIVETISFSGPRGKLPMRTKEGSVVRDADRLEAIGAVGIARVFTYGGTRGRTLRTGIEHFHEKLFLLRDLMETPTGRRLADARHAFMREYVRRFEAECLGEE